MRRGFIHLALCPISHCTLLNERSFSIMPGRSGRVMGLEAVPPPKQIALKSGVSAGLSVGRCQAAITELSMMRIESRRSWCGNDGGTNRRAPGECRSPYSSVRYRSARDNCGRDQQGPHTRIKRSAQPDRAPDLKRRGKLSPRRFTRPGGAPSIEL